MSNLTYPLDLRAALEEARQLLRGSKGTYFLASLIILAITFTLQFVLSLAAAFTLPVFVGSVLSGLLLAAIMAPFWGGMHRLDLARLQGHKVHANVIFQEFPNAKTHALVQLLLGIVPVSVVAAVATRGEVGFGIIALEGGLLALWYVVAYWAPFFVVDQDLSAIAAIRRGFAFGLRHFWILLVAYIVTTVIIVLSALPLFLGMLWTVPLTRLAFAALYRQQHYIHKDYSPAAPRPAPAAL